MENPQLPAITVVTPCDDDGVSWSAPVEITTTFDRFRAEVDWQAIATGPGHTSPHWPIARPYQSVSPQWVSRVIGATNPIWVDADADDKFSAARDYANALLQQAGGNVQKFVASLGSYDAAVAVQAAATARRSGFNLASRDFREALANGLPAVERAFVRVTNEERDVAPVTRN